MLRAEATLGTLRARWQRDDPTRGGAFVYYLDNFLAQLQSDNTRRAYSFAVLEFWDWYEQAHPGSPSSPDRIERRDAIAFADWLATRQFGLEEVRLKKDPDSRLMAAIYAIVKSKGSAHIADVRQSLLRIGEFTTSIEATARLRIEASDPLGLDKLLACMVEKKLLVREPSVEELRRRDPTLQNRLHQRVSPDLFTYQIDLHTKARGAAERASTIAARLTALSSLWTYFIEQTGENTGRQPLLSVNPWSAVLKQTLSVASSHRASRARPRRPTWSCSRSCSTRRRAGCRSRTSRSKTCATGRSCSSCSTRACAPTRWGVSGVGTSRATSSRSSAKGGGRGRSRCRTSRGAPSAS